MIVPAITRLSWSTLAWRSALSPIWTVRYVSSLVTSRGQRYWFQASEEREDGRGRRWRAGPAARPRPTGSRRCP